MLLGKSVKRKINDGKNKIKKKTQPLFTISYMDFSAHFVQTKTLEVLQLKLDKFVTKQMQDASLQTNARCKNRCKSDTASIWSASMTSSGKEKIISSWSKLGENWTQNSSHAKAAKQIRTKARKTHLHPFSLPGSDFLRIECNSKTLNKHFTWFLYQTMKNYWVKFDHHHLTAA